ncbi:MAG TPA: hypothetical protein VGM82_24840, partial [Gemmatimonadaceae bacterium]
QASASGDYGQASASGDYGQASASGDYGQASAGVEGRARAGDTGILVLRYFDSVASRDRLVIGYVGENGIEPGKWYKLDANRAIVESHDGDFSYSAFGASFALVDTCAKDARDMQLTFELRA